MPGDIVTVREPASVGYNVAALWFDRRALPKVAHITFPGVCPLADPRCAEIWWWHNDRTGSAADQDEWKPSKSLQCKKKEVNHVA